MQIATTKTALKTLFDSPERQLRALGVISAIPLSIISPGEREFFVLHMFVFLPLCFLYIARNGTHWSKLTTLDKIVLVYFSWAVLSLVLNLARAVVQKINPELEPRMFSAGAAAIYFVAPFLIGRVIFESERGLQAFVDGLLIGAVISALLYLGGYAYQWVVAPSSARYVIGQRAPMIMGFLAVVFTFHARSSLRVYGFILFLFWLLLWLSESRAVIFSFFLCLLLGVALFRKQIGARRLAVTGLALACAISIGFAVDKMTVNRFEWLLPSLSSPLPKTDTERSTPVDEGAKNAVRLPVPGATQNKTVTAFETGGHEALQITRWACATGLHDESSIMRLMMWETLLSHVGQDAFSTIFGFGQLGPAYIGERMISPNGSVMERYSAHSEYLDQVIRGGVVLLAVYIVILGAVVFYGIRIARISLLVGPTYLGVSVGLTGVIVYALFHESTRYPWFGILFWTLVGGLSSCIQRVDRQRVEPLATAKQK
jgi:hypothetical protein